MDVKVKVQKRILRVLEEYRYYLMKQLKELGLFNLTKQTLRGAMVTFQEYVQKVNVGMGEDHRTNCYNLILNNLHGKLEDYFNQEARGC